MSAQHLSFDELAELVEGLLSRRTTRDAKRHLASCDECRDRAAALEQTTAALNDLGPVVMPRDVAARLDRVLANASRESAGETVVPDLGAVRRRRQVPPRWLYAAAAAVVVITGVGIILGTAGGKKHTGMEASHGPAPLVATTAPHALIEQESGQVYTPTSLAAMATGLVGGGATATGGGSAGSAGAPNAQAPLAQPSPTDTQHSKYAPTAPQPMSGAATLPDQAFSSSLVPAPLRRYFDDKKTLQACASFITDTPGAAPVAVDYARWTNPATHARRTPALVMVFDDPQSSGKLDVYVVAPACGDSSLLDYLVIKAQ